MVAQKNQPRTRNNPRRSKDTKSHRGNNKRTRLFEPSHFINQRRTNDATFRGSVSADLILREEEFWHYETTFDESLEGALKSLDINIFNVDKYKLYKAIYPVVCSPHFDFNENDSLETVIHKISDMLGEDNGNMYIDASENCLVQLETSYIADTVFELNYDWADSIIESGNRKLGLAIKNLYNFIIARNTEIGIYGNHFQNYCLEDEIDIDIEDIEQLEDYLWVKWIFKHVQYLTEDRASFLKDKRLKVLKSNLSSGLFKEIGIHDAVQLIISLDVEQHRPYCYSPWVFEGRKIIDPHFEDSGDRPMEWFEHIFVGSDRLEGFDNLFHMSNDSAGNFGHMIYYNVFGDNWSYECNDLKNFMACIATITSKIYEHICNLSKE
ncbi:hypothetical protein [Mongoliitalea daihaiensis]|uniref:hypothetical protein n=1 Tax=Mongoliitalea daihaiensis TaxID=2782006 RepID=UPI001F1894C5|nr:hypothetical protein [Mongoliitalea daihaiensis]UJP64045.1 hypothetical protein IPZ59_14625 [Mongoliitalea daihaiensis]